MRRNTRCRFQYTISSVTNQPSRMNMQIASTLVPARPAEKRVLHEPPFCISGSINGGRLRLYTKAHTYTTAYTGEFLLAVYSCSRRAKYGWFYSSVASRYKVSQVQLTRTVFFQSQHNPFPLSLSSSISFYYSLQKKSANIPSHGVGAGARICLQRLDSWCTNRQCTLNQTNPGLDR
jgi:hypothetical protein